MGATERYVIGLVEQTLGPRDNRNHFPWALGDVSPKTGRAVELPFDGVWQARRLIIEVDEEQHSQPDDFFDKPETVTISGIHRGRQRKLYDRRKREAATQRGYTVLVIPWSRRRKRNPTEDLGELRALLADAGLL